MSSWAGCCPGAWPLLPVAGSCHLLSVPVCQTELSSIINAVPYNLKLPPCQAWSQSHGLMAANCANKKISRPVQKLFTWTHIYSAASLDKRCVKSQSCFWLLNNNEQHIAITCPYFYNKMENQSQALPMINSNSMEHSMAS